MSLATPVEAAPASSAPPGSGSAGAADDGVLERPSVGVRIKALAMVPVRLLRATFLPDKYLPPEVMSGRWGAAMLAVMLCGLFSALAVGSRLDVANDVLAEVAAGSGGEGMNGGGDSQGVSGAVAMSDREIQEKIAKDLAVARVTSALKATVGAPLVLLVASLVCFLLMLFVGGQPVMGKVVTAMTYSALPGAVSALMTGAAALTHPTLTPAQAQSLIVFPMFFGVWQIFMLGIGLSAAAGIKRWKAFTALIVFLAMSVGVVISTCGVPGANQDSGPPHSMDRGAR